MLNKCNFSEYKLRLLEQNAITIDRKFAKIYLRLIGISSLRVFGLCVAALMMRHSYSSSNLPKCLLYLNANTVNLCYAFQMHIQEPHLQEQNSSLLP